MSLPAKHENFAGQPSARDIALASRLSTTVSRLVKVLRKETRNIDLLSITERSTLSLLDSHTGLLPTELAAMEKVTTQSMSQVINHLTELGYVRRTPSSQDKRKILLSLTSAGKAYIEGLRQEKEEWLVRSLHERTTEKEKEVLLEAVDILSKLIDER